MPRADRAGNDRRRAGGPGQTGTYMNLSGLSVRELVEEHQVDVQRT